MKVKIVLRKIIAYTSLNKNIQTVDQFVTLEAQRVRSRGSDNERLLLDFI